MITGRNRQGKKKKHTQRFEFSLVGMLGDESLGRPRARASTTDVALPRLYFPLLSRLTSLLIHASIVAVLLLILALLILRPSLSLILGCG